MRKLLSFKNTRRDTIILDSHVEVVWWNGTQQWYIDRGYKYTGQGNKFWCKIEDLSPRASVRVNVRCPVCRQVRDIVYGTIDRVGHTICKGCAKTWDLTGMRFGRLIALEVDLNSSIGRKGTWWACQCDCGREHSVQSGNLLSGHIVSCGCYATDFLRAKIGEKHHSWNPELADEQRRNSRVNPGYGIWRRAVLRRDKRTCQVCGKKKKDGVRLDVHHLYSYQHHQEYQTEIWNGITLCHECHVEFHAFVGRNSTACTPADFCDWIISMS